MGCNDKTSPKNTDCLDTGQSSLESRTEKRFLQKQKKVPIFASTKRVLDYKALVRTQLSLSFKVSIVSLADNERVLFVVM